MTVAPLIHIADGQSDEILGDIAPEYIIDDTHRQSLEDTLETYEFYTFGDQPFTQHLKDRNRIIIPDEDGTLREFIIYESEKYRDTEGYKMYVIGTASYLDLKKANVIRPGSFTGTASQHIGIALNDTEWRPGIVEVSGTKTIHRDDFTNPFDYLKTLAREFEGELRFRIEHNGNRITGRFVDLLERIGEWRGREIEFGKDLDGIRRIENTERIVTALIGLGPEKEDGTRLEVLVEDEEALQRWGRLDPVNGELRHLIDVYEPQSERQDMTEQELRQYTRTELNKRINAVVTYECSVVDLENVPGMENKQIRFGDTIRIKDTKFNPPLYIEARVFEQERSIKSKAKKDIKLGAYIEYTEDEVKAIWNQLRQQIRDKISEAQLIEYTYPKEVIDTKDTEVKTSVEEYARTITEESKQEVIVYVDETIEPISVKVSELENEVSEHDGRISQAFTEIRQAWDEINLKASQTDVNEIEGRLTSAEGQISILAGQISLKADKTDVDNLTTRVSNVEVDIDALNSQISLKANQSEVDNLTGEVSSIQSQLTVMAGEIATKVEKDGVISAINQTAEQIKIQASRVDLSGYVTFTNLSTPGQTTIDGGNLKTGSITADKLNVTSLSAISADLGNITAGNIRGVTMNLGNGKFVVDSQGNVKFSGSLEGATGTFRGSIDTPMLTVGTDKIEGYDEFGLRLQTAQWQADLDNPFINTGYIVFNTLNDALELYKVDLTGKEVDLAGFRVNAKIMEFLGDVRAYGFFYSNAIDHFGGGIHLYVRPQSGGELRATVTGTTNQWVDIRGRFVYANSLDINTGTHVYIRPTSGGEVRATVTGTTGTYVPVRASSFPTGSLAEYKEDIHVWEESALEKIRNATVYEYYLKTEVEQGIFRKRQGLVIGEGYNTPDGVVDGDGVEQYLMNAWSWKAIQELDSEQMKMKDEIEWLKLENQYLKQKIQQLEAMVS